MTRYAIDSDRHAVTASWPTGHGDQAHTVALAPHDCETSKLMGLVAALNSLSTVVWRSYTHPASETADDGSNSRRRRRERDREAFTDVCRIVGAPPAEDFLTCHNPVLAAAQRVRGALADVGVGAVTDAVVAEVAAELTAVTDAERGALTGRARQAVTLSRSVPSPVQVAAAGEVLAAELFRADSLFTDYDPTSASVAAADWLYRAAHVAASVSGVHPVDVVAEADNISALPTATPTLVLGMLDDGYPSTEVVSTLVAQACTVAAGGIPDADRLTDEIDNVSYRVQAYGGTDPTLRRALLDELRLTPLDPMRPAPNLLEDLFAGMFGCWLLYQDHVVRLAADADDDDDLHSDGCLFQQFVADVRRTAQTAGGVL